MKILLSYLAGIVDGEGYIGIKKSSSMSKHNGSKSPIYHERIQIRMVNEKAIRLFKKTFGGNYYKEKAEQHNSRLPLYCYQSSDKQASIILKKLIPYLLVKKRDAQLVLLLRKRKNLKHKFGNGIGKMSDKELSKREELYKECKRLHSVGGDE